MKKEEKNKGICIKYKKINKYHRGKSEKLYVQYQRRDKQIEKKKVAKKVRTAKVYKMESRENIRN